MKKFGKIMVLFVALFGLTANVCAANKWDATRSEYGKTSDGVSVSFDKEKKIITYTIGEEYSEGTVYFNIVEDLKTILSRVYTPGSDALFTIRIVNNSNYKYLYLEKSLTIDTLTWNKNFEVDYQNYGEDVYYPSSITALLDRQYVKGTKAFDGSILDVNYTIDRTANKAIIELLRNSEKYVDGKYEFNGTKYNIGNYIDKILLIDENLGNELKSQGYAGGIADLDKYYLAFYNNLYGLDAKTLYDYDNKVITGNNGIFNGNNSFKIPETNPAVSSFGYDWFYNKGLMVSPVSDALGNEIKKSDLEKGKYFIGNYMRGENTVFEEVFKKDFALIDSLASAELTKLDLNLSGENITNAFGGMNFGYMMSFQLEREVVYGNVVVNYVDEEYNKLTESITLSDVVGEKYQTEEKSFENYELLRVEGNENGTYVENEIIEVTYVYTNAIGDVVPNDPEPNDPEPIEPPHTDVEVQINYNQSNIIYFVEDKKRKLV